MWKQVKTPTFDPVLYQYGEILWNWVGWCLSYVQTAFGAGYSGPTALISWQGGVWNGVKHGIYTQGRHVKDTKPPTGVWVPLWYSGFNGWGHVLFAKFNSDGSGIAYTSPNDAKATYDKINFSSLSNLTAQLRSGWANDMTYLGWSEYVGATRVIQYIASTPATQPTTTKGNEVMNEEDLTAIYTRGPLALGGYQTRKRKSKEGSDVYLGKSAAFVINDHYNSAEAKAKRASLKEQFNALQADIKQLEKQAGKPVTVQSDADKKLSALKKAFQDAGLI